MSYSKSRSSARSSVSPLPSRLLLEESLGAAIGTWESSAERQAAESCRAHFGRGAYVLGGIWW